MTDLDEGLRRTICGLADRMPTTELADSAVRGGKRRQTQRRSALATAGVSIAVAAVVTSVALLPGSSGSVGTPSSSHSAPTVVASGDQPTPFDVAPAPVTIIGGVDISRRACRPAEIRGNATTRQTPYGVVGVVNLSPAHHCDIHLAAIHPTLLDQHGQSLTVPVAVNADKRNPAMNAGWTPRTSFGFAWNGSWCGPVATQVEAPLRQGYVRVQLTGPQPACSGTSTSVILPGTTGYPGSPLQAAPPAWRSLTASLTVAPATPTATLHALRLTLTNQSDHSIQLAPTPTYFIGVRDKYGDGTQGEGNHRLTISNGPGTVPAHGTLRVDLPPESISDDFTNLRGPMATITFEMAGVPSATATTYLP